MNHASHLTRMRLLGGGVTAPRPRVSATVCKTRLFHGLRLPKVVAGLNELLGVPSPYFQVKSK